MANSVEKELYPYYIVEFVSRGRKPSVKKVDIVVGSWLAYNDKLHKCMTKYPDESLYDTLEEYLQNLYPPCDSWPFYTVIIRGRATTLEEAHTKLLALNSETSALTMGSDESAGEAEQKEVDNIRRNNFLKAAASLKSNSSVSTQLKKPSFEVKDKSLRKRANVIQAEKRNDYEDSAVKKQKNVLQRSFSDLLSTNPKNQAEKQNSNSNDIEFSKPLSTKTSSKNQQDQQSSVLTSSQLTSNRKSLESTSNEVLNEVIKLNSIVMELKAEITKNTNTIEKLQSLILQNSETNVNFVATSKQLETKYNYKIPFFTIEEFELFNNDLNNSEILYTDVKSVLLSAMDINLTISKCIVNMLKMFLTKDVAKNYTAVKNIQGKKIMKTTSFYRCMEAVIKERRLLVSMSVTEKEFNTALSNVLTNVSGWKGKYDTQEGSTNNENVNVEEGSINNENVDILNQADGQLNDNQEQLDITGTYALLPSTEDFTYDLQKML